MDGASVVGVGGASMEGGYEYENRVYGLKQ
jgi:hypothetical protein